MAENNFKAARGQKVNHKKGIAAAKKAQRRAEAETRKAAHDKLTVAQRIAELDMMFGVGLGAKAERARLLNPKPKAAPAVVKEEPKAAPAVVKEEPKPAELAEKPAVGSGS